MFFLLLFGIYMESPPSDAFFSNRQEVPFRVETEDSSTQQVLGPQVNIAWVNSHKILISVSAGRPVKSVDYQLQYKHSNGVDGLVGQADAASQTSVNLGPFVLGTCSSGGTCVYHQGVSNLQINLDILYADGSQEALHWD